jgi:hypothetical protein
MPGKSPRRTPSSLTRRVAIRRPRKTLVIFCEGEQTEPIYLEALKQQPEVRNVASVDLRIEAKHGVPETLVAAAIEARDKSIDEEGEVDEFWCVFDVEWPRNHPRLHEAVNKARDNSVKLAISNPCFELWLILHHERHGSWLDNDDARRLRRRLDGAPGKGLDPAKYMPKIHAAIKNAAALDHADARSTPVEPEPRRGHKDLQCRRNRRRDSLPVHPLGHRHRDRSSCGDGHHRMG